MTSEKTIPSATIITICRNEARLLRATMESVLSQTFRDFEYIVIDGASTDGTADIVRGYADRLAWWVSEKDAGIYAAMNKGICKARGEYILFLNGGDSLAAPDILERTFALRRDEDILYGDIYKNESESGHRYLCSLSGYMMTPFFLFSHTLPHQGSFIKKRLFDDYGLYDEGYRLLGDYEFFKRSIIQHHATSYYLGFPISFFDLGGVSTRADHKAIQRWEARKARISTYGLGRYLIFGAAWAMLDLLVYRPRRKLRTLTVKS